MNFKKSPPIHPKLAIVLLVLSLIAAVVFYVQLSKELDASQKGLESHLPEGALSPEGVRQGDASNTPSPAAKEDPFKAFLEAKARNPQAPALPHPDPSFVPGTDPFKAKLEEQRNAPHSAVSPFKN